MLRIRGLSRQFAGYPALSDINLDLFPGEILGLIGPNGAGKSTLMRCLAGFDEAYQGSIAYGSGSHSAFYLPDLVVPYAELAVGATLTLFAQAFAQPMSLVERVIGDLKLEPVRGRAAGKLSKGYRRRLFLALALLAPQPLLLLDEPFDGLDLHQIRSVVDLLRRLPEQGRTLLLSIHQLRDAERICDRFALLAEGRLVALGDLESLRRQAGLATGDLEEVFYALTEPTLA